MAQFYLACDESGRLGYVDKSVHESGEITVVAGLISDIHSFPAFAKKVSEIVSKYKSKTKVSKFHITDFAPDVAASVRRDIFVLLEEFGYPLVYGAQYYSAFARIYQSQRSLADSVTSKQKELGISVSYPLQHIKKLSQAECFYSLYTKASCFLAGHCNRPFYIDVVSDEMDNKTLESYGKQIIRLHRPEQRKPLYGKRFIQSTKSLEKFSVSSNLDLDLDLPISEILAASTGSISKEQVVHSIVADVIANSVHYYLAQYAERTGYHHLNIQAAISEHPLAKQFIGLGVDSTLTDRLYCHTVA